MKKTISIVLTGRRYVSSQDRSYFKILFRARMNVNERDLNGEYLPYSMQVPPSAPCAPQIMAPPPPPSSAAPATLALMPDLEVREEFLVDRMRPTRSDGNHV